MVVFLLIYFRSERNPGTDELGYMYTAVIVMFVSWFRAVIVFMFSVIVYETLINSDFEKIVIPCFALLVGRMSDFKGWLWY